MIIIKGLRERWSESQPHKRLVAVANTAVGRKYAKASVWLRPASAKIETI